MQSADSDRSFVRHLKKARDASPPPQDDPQTRAGPVVPQVVVPNDKDYPPLPQTGANSKRKTTTTKPGFHYCYYYYWPALQEHQFADTVKKRLTHQQLVERQPDFCKADAAAWLALRRDTLIPAHSAPKVELSSGIPDSSMQVDSPYAKPGDLRKAMKGARIRTSAMEHVSKIDRRTTKHGARFRITVPEDRQRKHHPAPRAPKQANPLAYSAKLPTSPSRPASTNSPTSTTITADPRSQCCQHQQQTPAIRHIVRNTRLWAISETCITSSNSALLSLDSMSSSIQPLGPGRRGIALGIPSCFGGHEHGSAVGTMILAKVPNFTPEFAERRFASIRQALDRVVPFDNNHPVLIFGDWNTDPQRLQRIVHSWGHGLTVMQFSGSQITRLSTVHGRRHSSIDHFVCNAPARALLTSPRVDRQTAVVDHFVIRTKQIWTSCWLNGDCGA
ncbi:hypothetical protein BASA61_003319 [Batrachochytrium salamandrivorans]|nr:hypothetical protein BASA61_003319 [Batrachochytrium salamandrivorans]